MRRTRLTQAPTELPKTRPAAARSPKPRSSIHSAVPAPIRMPVPTPAMAYFTGVRVSWRAWNALANSFVRPVATSPSA